MRKGARNYSQYLDKQPQKYTKEGTREEKKKKQKEFLFFLLVLFFKKKKEFLKRASQEKRTKKKKVDKIRRKNGRKKVFVFVYLSSGRLINLAYDS